MSVSDAEKLKQEGNALFKRKAYEQALAKYQAAISRQANFKEAHHNAGLCHKQLNRWEAAWECFHQAVQIDPTYRKAVSQRQRCYERIGAMISFGIADIKLTAENKVVILELGAGMQSGFNGYRQLYTTTMDKILEDQLHQLNLPFLLTSRPGFNLKPIYRSLDTAMQALPSKPTFNVTDFSSYSGICGGLYIPAVDAHVLRLDGFPMMDMVCGDKILFDEIMKGHEELQRHRPMARTYSRTQNISATCQDILRHMQADYYVIKIPDLQRGEGVFVAHRDTLRSVLAQCLKQADRKGSNNPDVVVESLVSGKPIQHRGRAYDATMRVAYLIRRGRGKMHYHHLGAYWKLPKTHVNDIAASKRDQIVSSVGNSPGQVASVSGKDLASVTGQMQHIMPALFSALLNFDHEQYIRHLRSDAQDSKRKLGVYYQLRRANAYGTIGQFTLAHYDVDDLIRTDPRHSKAHHEKGVIYFRQGEYQQAIAAYEQAYALDSTVETQFRHAQACFHQGDREKALTLLGDSPGYSRLAALLKAQMTEEFIPPSPLLSSDLIEHHDYLIPIPAQTSVEDMKVRIHYFCGGVILGDVQRIRGVAFVKAQIASCLLTKPIRKQLNVDRVMIPPLNAKGRGALKTQVTGVVIETSQNSQGEPRWLLTFPTWGKARADIDRITKNRQYKGLSSTKTPSVARLLHQGNMSAFSQSIRGGSDTAAMRARRPRLSGIMEISQDGIGRLSRTDTPETITGLYTAGLQTCIAFIIVSQKGISLIHATKMMQDTSVMREIQWHGTILFWTIVVNPTYYPNIRENEKFMLFMGRFIEKIEQAAGKHAVLKGAQGMKVYESCHGCVGVTRKGAIKVDDFPGDFSQLPHRHDRHQINVVNNYFLRDHERVPADLQFDVDHYTGMPALYKTRDEIAALMQETKFVEAQETDELHRLYMRFSEEIASCQTQGSEAPATLAPGR